MAACQAENQSSSHSVMKRLLAWMSICRSGPLADSAAPYLSPESVPALRLAQD